MLFYSLKLYQPYEGRERYLSCDNCGGLNMHTFILSVIGYENLFYGS